MTDDLGSRLFRDSLPIGPSAPQLVIALRAEPRRREDLEGVARQLREALGDDVVVRRSFPLDLELLDHWQATASERLDREVPHLGRYLRVGGDREWLLPDLSALRDSIDALDTVDVSGTPTAAEMPRISAPGPTEGCLDLAVATGSAQPYLQAAAQGGLGIAAAWSAIGDAPWDIRLCDCERGFECRHVDLPEVTVVSARGRRLDFEAFHGTGTLGVLGAWSRSARFQGIAHGCEALFASETGGFRPQAIADGLACLREGDVLALEMQAYTRPRHPLEREVRVPAEYDADVWAVSLTAAGLGILVVAAAGNGDTDLASVELDEKPHPWRGDRNGDSLAVLVGAGNSRTLLKTTGSSGSNYGGRVTCQGWGEGIVAPRDGRSARELHDCFMDDFDGTSAATAMIAGVAACAQAFAKRKRRSGPLDPRELRDLLAKDDLGKRMAGDPGERIGPSPDLERLLAAIARM